MNRINIALSITTSLVLALCAYGQKTTAASSNSAADTPVIHSRARYVLVPVVVKDKKNHHVAGLTVADFQILEDGKAQKISSVEELLADHESIAKMPKTEVRFTGQKDSVPAV